MTSDGISEGISELTGQFCMSNASRHVCVPPPLPVCYLGWITGLSRPVSRAGRLWCVTPDGSDRRASLQFQIRYGLLEDSSGETAVLPRSEILSAF